MTPDEFRAVGARMVEYIASYMERMGGPGSVEVPVRSRVEPGDIERALPESAPMRGPASGEGSTDGAWDAIFADLDRIIMPGLTHWQHPSFFGYFPANSTGPAILGELLSAGLGVQGMLWQTGPAITELETRMLDWMARACGLPGAFLSSPTSGGVIQGTASEATLVALVAAKRRMQKLGVDGRAVVYCSDQAHSSVVKAAMIAGVANGQEDPEAVRAIGVDRAFAMRPDLLAQAIREDRRRGLAPTMIVGTVGTTSSTAVDPLRDIALAARDAGFSGWLHADGAHSGAAAVCEEHRWMLAGLDLWDSYCFNPHKWLLVNFDCDLLYTRDRPTLVDALSILPEYLRNEATNAGSVIDYRDWQIPLGRRFRALKLWFTMRHYGIEGLRAHIRAGVAMAERFEALVAGDARFALCAPRSCNLVCFRLRPAGGETAAQTDARNMALLRRLNDSGRMFLTHTALALEPGAKPSVVLRMAIGGVNTRPSHVDEAWGEIADLRSP